MVHFSLFGTENMKSLDDVLGPKLPATFDTSVNTFARRTTTKATISAVVFE